MQKIPLYFWPALSGTSKIFIQHFGYIKHEQHKKTHALFRNRLAKNSQSNSSKLLKRSTITAFGTIYRFWKNLHILTWPAWPGNKMYFLQNSFRKSCPPLTGMSLCTSNLDLNCKCHTTSLWIISYSLCFAMNVPLQLVQFTEQFFIDHNNPS